MDPSGRAAADDRFVSYQQGVAMSVLDTEDSKRSDCRLRRPVNGLTGDDKISKKISSVNRNAADRDFAGDFGSDLAKELNFGFRQQQAVRSCVPGRGGSSSLLQFSENLDEEPCNLSAARELRNKFTKSDDGEDRFYSLEPARWYEQGSKATDERRVRTSNRPSSTVTGAKRSCASDEPETWAIIDQDMATTVEQPKTRTEQRTRPADRWRTSTTVDEERPRSSDDEFTSRLLLENARLRELVHNLLCRLQLTHTSLKAGHDLPSSPLLCLACITRSPLASAQQQRPASAIGSRAEFGPRGTSDSNENCSSHYSCGTVVSSRRSVVRKEYGEDNRRRHDPEEEWTGVAGDRVDEERDQNIAQDHHSLGAAKQFPTENIGKTWPSSKHQHLQTLPMPFVSGRYSKSHKDRTENLDCHLLQPWSPPSDLPVAGMPATVRYKSVLERPADVDPPVDCCSSDQNEDELFSIRSLDVFICPRCDREFEPSEETRYLDHCNKCLDD